MYSTKKMAENLKEKQEKKGVFSKIKENIDDKEEQMAFLGTLIRLGVMVWAGFIISLNYITLPGITEDREVKDITFIASVFTADVWLLLILRQVVKRKKMWEMELR